MQNLPILLLYIKFMLKSSRCYIFQKNLHFVTQITFLSYLCFNKFMTKKIQIFYDFNVNSLYLVTRIRYNTSV